MSTVKKKTAHYQPFTSAEKLAPSLLLAIALPFTVLFFGPFEAYCKNIEEFGFAFGDFGWLSFAAALLCGAVLFFVLWKLPGKVFDITYAVLFAVALMLYLQGNYLNLGLNAVEGDGVGNATYTAAALVINLIVWLAVIAGAVLLMVFIRRQREIMRLVSIIALVVVVGIQVMMFALLSLTTEVFTPLTKRGMTDDSGDVASSAAMPGILTNAGMTTVGEDGNVIWIVIDRFDLDYHNAILQSDPDFYENLEGFTLYDNHISKYARTYPAIAYMLTGVENDYSTSRVRYFEKAYGEGTFLKELADNGYNVKLYTDDFYAYENGNVFDGYTENVRSSTDYAVTDRISLWGDMLRLTLFRYLPIAAKGTVGMISSGDFNKHIAYDTENPLYVPDMKDAYEWLTAEAMSMQEGKNFTFLHIDGCHTPNKYYEDFSEVTDTNDKWDNRLSMRVSFLFVNYFLSELKRLGLYENTTIVITGDHAAAHSDTDDISGERVTTLLVKKKGESEGALKVNHAPVEQSQIRASILQSEGIVPKNDYGVSIFNTPEDADITRYYHFQKTVIGGDDELVIYAVRGDAKNFANWTLTERINVGDLYK